MKTINKNYNLKVTKNVYGFISMDYNNDNTIFSTKSLQGFLTAGGLQKCRKIKM